MGIKAVLKRGGRILLFPEGRCTVAGAYMGMHKATGKLIKKLNVPVVSCRLEGSYACMPFWRKGIRLGQTRVTLQNLFSAGETQPLPVEEINRRIDARLSGTDAPPSKPLRTFGARRLAEGLHNILYRCPGCGRELTLTTGKNTIACTVCGYSLTLDRTGLDRVQDWYREQTIAEMRRLSEDMEPIVIPVTIRTPGAQGAGMTPCGTGRLSLTPKGWHYGGELSGERVSLFFPIDTVPALPFDPDEDFQIYAHGSFYDFMPEDGRLCSKYATIGECAYWRFASNVQMTPGQNGGFAENMVVRQES
jgi:hypothetical protein